MAENEPTEQTVEEQIEEIAALQFSEEEIAVIVGLALDEIIEKYPTEVMRGRLLAEAEVRRSIAQLAKQGSTPAQKQFIELNRAAKANSLIEEMGE